MKAILKKIGIAVLFLLIGLNVYILISGKFYIYNALYYNFAGIEDYKIFHNRKIQTASPQPWPIATQFNKQKISGELRNVLESTNSVALLLVKNDSLLYEEYWDGYSDTSLSNSFSMAKSIISILIGAAIKEGKIKSVDQKVADFLDDFKTEGKQDISIKDVLMMSSGLKWDEAYANPFSITTEVYYGNDLVKTMSGLPSVKKSGEEFIYQSGDTQILGFVLEKATGKSISDYASEKLWQPIGAERLALWSLDKENGHEKAYCCVNSNARDFARIGQLYLNNGNWKGTQIVDSSYAIASVSPNGLKYGNGKCDFYGYQWWIIPDLGGEKVFYARGILGQLIIVMPERRMVAVRLGHSNGGREGVHFKLVYDIVKELKSR